MRSTRPVRRGQSNGEHRDATTGAVLLALKRCDLMRVGLPAQTAVARMGWCISALCGTTGVSKNIVKPVLTSDCWQLGCHASFPTASL